MGRLVLIDALAAITTLILWYFGFSRYNRRRGAKALRRVEAACSGRGRIVEARWLGACHLQARMKFFGNWLETGQVTLRLRPRPVPLQWFLSAFRKDKETLTFETDLGWSPSFDLQVYRHRWVTHKQQSKKVNKNWSISRPGPVVLTTRSQWTQELTPVVNALMMSRGHNLVSVRFRQESPQLAATIPLDALTGEQEVATFLNVIHDLATGASAPHI